MCGSMYFRSWGVTTLFKQMPVTIHLFWFSLSSKRVPPTAGGARDSCDQKLGKHLILNRNMKFTLERVMYVIDVVFLLYESTGIYLLLFCFELSLLGNEYGIQNLMFCCMDHHIIK